MTITTPKTPGRVNYLNNKDLLKQIHFSKNTYCSFVNPATDHQYDIILDSVNKINADTIAEAKQNRADRVGKETGKPFNVNDVLVTDLVFRVTTWEHIPIAPPKVPKISTSKKKKEVAEILDFDDSCDDEEELLVDPDVQDPIHVRVNFPPFYHYRLTDNLTPYVVGKSHWKGDIHTGEYNRDHGNITPELARMFLKLCERYATRSNWRGYTYNEEMRGQALLQLSQIGLQFNEAKSQNPFAYYTAAITNSFTRILNIEKKNQNIRDDILEINGLTPSWTRQNSQAEIKAPGPVKILSGQELEDYIKSVQDSL